MPAVAPNALREQVYASLMARLARRELALGAHLKADEVARDLAVSAATARKAIARLLKDGWLRAGENGRPIVARYPARKAVPEVAAFLGRADRARQEVLDLALAQGFRPGEVIKARPLAVKLGLSLPTVRSDLERLTREGVFERLPRRGWRVAELSLSEIRTMFEVRRRLEPMVLVRAFRRIDDALVDSLLADTAELIANFRDLPRVERVQAEYRFHRALVDMAGDAVLAEVLNPLIRKMMMVLSVTHGLSRSSWAEHQRILEAIKRRDLDGALACLKRDLDDPLEADFADFE
jgi:DNA-binding GntR family transcriptional regulator